MCVGVLPFDFFLCLEAFIIVLEWVSPGVSRIKNEDAEPIKMEADRISCALERRGCSLLEAVAATSAAAANIMFVIFLSFGKHTS